MPDFELLQNPLSKKWVILAPRRARRPDVAKGVEPVCPFCLGREKDEPEIYRVGGETGDSNWQIRVLPNKFPFAPIHEVIIHSQEHDKRMRILYYKFIDPSRRVKTRRTRLDDEADKIS